MSAVMELDAQEAGILAETGHSNPAEDEMATIETASSFTRVLDPSNPDDNEIDETQFDDEGEAGEMDLEPQSTIQEEMLIDEAVSGSDDDTRVDLEVVENHMRHAGSNVGPFHETDMPVVLGRDVFKKFDKSRVRGLISRDHCRIEASVGEGGDVRYFVKDTSVNGTFLGPHRILPNGPGALLQHGDVIGLLTSHSSPIETYSAEGEVFKVTLGLRWLRPTQNPHAASDGHIGSQIDENNLQGVFYGVNVTNDEQVTQKLAPHGSRNLFVSAASRTRTSSSSTPNSSTRSSRKPQKKTNTDDREGSTESRRLALKNQNHSGNDTDDTDGDDEMDPAPSHKTPAAKAGRKPIAVSKPSFDEPTYESPLRLATPHSSTSSKRSMGKSPKLHTPNRNSPALSPSSSTTSIAHSITPGSYWKITPGNRSKKRTRDTANDDPTDHLSDQEPAQKIRRV